MPSAFRISLLLSLAMLGAVGPSFAPAAALDRLQPDKDLGAGWQQIADAFSRDDWRDGS